DAVAGFGDGLDDRWVAELAPEPADGDLDGVGEGVGGLVPDPLEELLGGNDPALGCEQQLEDTELLGRKVEWSALSTGASLRGVELEVVVAQNWRYGRLGAAIEGVDAGDEHGEVERLGEVVVGAAVEPVDEVVHRGRGGEHQDSAATACVDELGADLVA